MSAFGPRPPQFELYYAAIDKQTGQMVATGMSAPGVLADASEKTGLPKDCFELRGLAGRMWAKSSFYLVAQRGGRVQNFKANSEFSVDSHRFDIGFGQRLDDNHPSGSVVYLRV
jgi:hypothetical protein